MSGSEWLQCLLVRQPYASLIAYGTKRVEFRSYSTRVRGRIGIAASKGPPLETLDSHVSTISTRWPRGLVLATALLAGVEYWDSHRLKQYTTRVRDIRIHDDVIRVYDSPLGEPLADVDFAAKQSDWRSWVWILKDVRPLGKPREYFHAGKSTWGKVLIER